MMNLPFGSKEKVIEPLHLSSTIFATSLIYD